MRAYIRAVSISCISIVGHYEISKKSNSVRTAWPKSTKLSGIIGLGDPTSHARQGAPPPPVSPLGGAKGFQINSIFSVTTVDSAAVLSNLCAPLGCLYSAPNHWGPGPPIWGSGPPNQNFTFFDPENFWHDCFFVNFTIARGNNALATEKFLGKLVTKNSVKMGVKIDKLTSNFQKTTKSAFRAKSSKSHVAPL